MLVEDYDVRIAGSAGDENLPVSNGQIRVYHDFGYDGALFAGYDLGGARIEAEVSYKKAQINDGRFAVPVPGDPLVGGPPDDAATGSTSALAFMVNDMLDIGDADGLPGFIVGGIGYATVQANTWRRFQERKSVVQGERVS